MRQVTHGPAPPRRRGECSPGGRRRSATPVAVLRQSGVEGKRAGPLVDAGIGSERPLLTLGSVGRAMHPANASVHEAVSEPNVVLPVKAKELVCAHAGPLELLTP